MCYEIFSALCKTYSDKIILILLIRFKLANFRRNEKHELTALISKAFLTSKLFLDISFELSYFYEL